MGSFAAVNVRVVVRNTQLVGDGDADVVHEVTAPIDVDASIDSLDDAFSIAPRVVAQEFMRLGEIDIFTVTVRATHFQQGSTGTTLEVLVELREALQTVSYEVLAGLILKLLVDALGSDRDDDKG